MIMSETPNRIGPYQIERLLGRGGMGEVYLARDPRENCEVALKVLSAESANNSARVQRFRDEARIVASIDHPNIAGVHAFETDGTQALLALEYVPGQSLAEILRQRRLTIPETLDLAEQLAKAIQAAHEAGLVHRDLKPGNVMIRPDGVVKVLDFGLARDLSNSATGRVDTSKDSIVGTAGYAAPEQLRRRNVGQQVDLWGYGCVLFECLCGQKAFGGVDVRATVLATIHSSPNLSLLPEDTPPGLRELIGACLAKSTKERITDFQEVLQRLQSVQRQVRRAERPVERTLAPILASMMALLLIGILLWALQGNWTAGSGKQVQTASASGTETRVVTGLSANPGTDPTKTNTPQPSQEQAQPVSGKVASNSPSQNSGPTPQPEDQTDHPDDEPSSGDPNDKKFDADSLRTFSEDIKDPPRIAGGGGSSIFVDDGRGKDIVYIIDYSHSMNGTRLESAKAELIADIEGLDPSSRFYVIFFDVDQNSIPRSGLMPAGKSNKLFAKRWIENTQATSGATDPSLAVKKAFKLKPDTIYLLSDGEFNELIPGDIADANSGLGIVINTIAFHSLKGRDVLEQVAKLNYGVFVYVPETGIP